MLTAKGAKFSRISTCHASEEGAVSLRMNVFITLSPMFSPPCNFYHCNPMLSLQGLQGQRNGRAFWDSCWMCGASCAAPRHSVIRRVQLPYSQPCKAFLLILLSHMNQPLQTGARLLQISQLAYLSPAVQNILKDFILKKLNCSMQCNMQLTCPLSSFLYWESRPGDISA